MARIFVPANTPDDWRPLLGDPQKHWKTGYSARTLAHCWHGVEGLPPEIASLLRDVDGEPELLFAIPEYKVPLPGARRGESQNDLFALIRSGSRTISVAVEGKVNEPFGERLSDWIRDASDGKKERLNFLCDLMQLKQPLPGDIAYQLLHRTASALIEAQRFKTDAAAMIVHSFSDEGMWFDAFARFAALFGISAEKNRLHSVQRNGPALFLGWATGDLRFLAA